MDAFDWLDTQGTEEAHAVRDELTALRKDAMRYHRWRTAYIRRNMDSGVDTCSLLKAIAEARTPEQFDAAIDTPECPAVPVASPLMNSCYRLDAPMGQFHSSGRMLYWCDEAGCCIGIRWLKET